MIFDSVSWRIPATVAVSLVLHGLLLSHLGPLRMGGPVKRLELTEVEFQEEASKPTEMEKLMNHLAAPKPAAAPAPRVSEAETAIAELKRESFREVVGIKAQPRADVVTESELTRLADLPKLSALTTAPAPAALAPAVKHIALAPSRPSPQEGLESKVVPLAELPPADFAPDISRRGFQQPELIIKQVKAERRQQPKPAVDAEKQLSLARDSFISGEIKGREILHQEYPAVPRWLEEKGVEAEVVISFVVDPDGEVGDRVYVEKTSGYAELDRLAIEALKRFTFAPLPLTAKQVEQKGAITIRFTFRGK